jgi:hypothetical protein
MSRRSFDRWLPYGAVLGFVASAAHLGWEATHGGVQSHHLLAREDLPALSNWWGLFVLPVLGWMASRLAVRRVRAGADTSAGVMVSLVGALLVGAALSGSFAAGFESVTSGVFFAVLAVGLVLPTYRMEYVFGFVLGMTVVVGAVLPTLVASVAAAIAAVAHLLLYPGCLLLLRKLRA